MGSWSAPCAREGDAATTESTDLDGEATNEVRSLNNPVAGRIWLNTAILNCTSEEDDISNLMH